MLAGNVTIMMLFMINAIFRGAGDAAIAMRVLWLANAINIVLGPCFIFGLGPFPKLGIVGAAVATNIGRGTGALYAFSRLVRSGGRFDIQRHHFRLEPAIMARLVRLSATGTFQVFIGMASWIGLVRTISSFGTDVVAGYIVGIRVILFALLPSWGMSNAAATMVGQALGAKNPERAERAVWKAGFYNMIFLGCVGLVFVLLARQIIGLFTTDPNVGPLWSRLFAHCRFRLSLLRLGNGDYAVVQWCRRHLDPNHHQPVCLLAVGTSARLRAGHSSWFWTTRRLSRNHDRVFNAGSCKCDVFSQRQMEEAGGLSGFHYSNHEFRKRTCPPSRRGTSALSKRTT